LAGAHLALNRDPLVVVMVVSARVIGARLAPVVSLGSAARILDRIR
jgi:hypothetical protein